MISYIPSRVVGRSVPTMDNSFEDAVYVKPLIVAVGSMYATSQVML